MSLRAAWAHYVLRFKFEARTSRETMTVKPTYFVKVYDDVQPDGPYGYGECALFRGLSADDVPDYEDELSRACADPAALSLYPSIRFGLESAIADYNLHRGVTAPGAWERGEVAIPINGLIWMGDKATMAARIARKLDAGCRVLKLKIGGINFDDEVDLLRFIRSKFSPSSLELRLDANGSFDPAVAMERLDCLARYAIHSIEQPVAAGRIELMAHLCRESPIPVALDEELIGLNDHDKKQALLDAIKPRYIILKPALIGGTAEADDWIECAERAGIGWWATSALESNIGLNAIASWLSRRGFDMPQGLGTGALYHNNIPSPVYLAGASAVSYDPTKCFEMPQLTWN